MAGLVIDDFTGQTSLCLARAAGATLDFAGQTRSLGRRGPSLFCDRCGRTVRATVMFWLGLRDIVKARVGRTMPRAVTARTGGRQPESIANSAVAPTNSAVFRGQRRRSILERSHFFRSSIEPSPIATGELCGLTFRPPIRGDTGIRGLLGHVV